MYRKLPVVTNEGVVDFWLANERSFEQGTFGNRLEVYIIDLDGEDRVYLLKDQDAHGVGISTDSEDASRYVPYLASYPGSLYSLDRQYLVQLKRVHGRFQPVAWVCMDDYHRCLATMKLRTADTTGLPPKLRQLISKAVSEAMIAPGIAGQMPAPGAI